MGTPYDGFAEAPVIPKLTPLAGELRNIGPAGWTANGGVIAAAFDEFEQTSAIWRWSPVDGPPERAVTSVKGRVTELVPDAAGGRAIVGVTHAPDGIGAVTARTDLYLVRFHDRSVLPIFTSSEATWIRLRAYARFSPDESRIAFSFNKGAGRPPFAAMLVVCQTATGEQIHQIEQNGTVTRWTDRGLLVRAQPGRPGAATYHLFDDQTGRIADGDSPSTSSPDGEFEVTVRETSLSIRSRDGHAENVPAAKQTSWIRGSQPWLAPHWLLYPVDFGWLALDVKTRAFHRLFAPREGGHPIPSPDGGRLLVHRSGELFWAAP